MSSDSFRTIDEKNRDDINKYFSTNIENGTICHPCYNEYERWRKESGGAEEENQLSFPFCYGVNASKDDHPTFDLTGSVSDGEAEETESEESDQDTLHDVNKSLDQAFMGMNSTDAAQMLNSLFANAKKDTPPIFPVTPTPLLFPTTATTTTPTHQPILPAPPPFTVPSLTTSTVNPLNLSSKIKKKSRPGRTPKDRLPLTLSATSATSDLSYLSTLKVSELQEQLKRYNASTKGSKAQLIQRLVRYICLFNTNRYFPPPPSSSQRTSLCSLLSLHLSRSLSLRICAWFLFSLFVACFLNSLFLSFSLVSL